MALNSSGPISLGGATVGQSINVELGQTSVTTISLNDTNVRTLAGVASGAITMPTNFWGKSSANNFITLFSASTALYSVTDCYGYDSLGNLYVALINGNTANCIIYKFDSNNNLLWQKNYTSGGLAIIFTCFLVTDSAVYLGMGLGIGTLSRQPSIFKIDTNGNIVSAIRYTAGATSAQQANSLAMVATNNGYIHVITLRATNRWRFVVDTSLNMAGTAMQAPIPGNLGFPGCLVPTTNQVIFPINAGITVSPSNSASPTTTYGGNNGQTATGCVTINPTTGEIFTTQPGMIQRYSSSFVANLNVTLTPFLNGVQRSAAHNGTYFYTLTANGVLLCFDNNLNKVWERTFTCSLGAIDTQGNGYLKIASNGSLLIILNINAAANKTFFINTKSDGSQLTSLSKTIGGITLSCTSTNTVTVASTSFTPTSPVNWTTTLTNTSAAGGSSSSTATTTVTTAPI
jgi:hypothetical protein